MDQSMPRVLVVDDDEDDYLIARDILREGVGACQTTWAPSFAEGIAALDRGDHDVALVDFRLGAETGLDLLACADAHGWRTPIILLTGLDDAHVDRLAAESGAADYLVKQRLDATTLERAVRYAIARAEILSQARESEERFRSIVEHASDAIVITDDRDRITLWNPAATALFGFRAEEVLDTPLAQTLRLVVAPSDGGDGTALEAVATRKDETHVALEISRAAWTASRGEHTSHILRDVTERAQLQRRLHEQATTDPLTGLPNRTYFRTALENAATSANENPARSYATLFIDLDDFKLINDRHGHATGDEVLRQAATRIKSQLRDEDLAARLGGDEFAVLIAGVSTPEAIDDITRRLLDELARPYDVAGERCHAGASIGAALHRRHQPGTDVLQDADVAMYAAKAKGKGQAKIYAPEQRRTLIHRAELARTLRDTPIDTGFELHYQPIVELATRHVVGVEALLRWRHPTLGLLAGDRFIDLAEETGLIVPLGAWVLHRALAQLGRWRDGSAVSDRFTMSVNLSGTQLADGLEQTVTEALARVAVPHDLLCLEVTETSLLDTAGLDVLTRLRDRGVTIAIDDFGSGYSSLAQLTQLPIDELKIDTTFVKAMETDGVSAKIVRASIELAHNLGLTAVAEGVETARSWEMLRTLSCDLAQGYHLGKPMPHDDFARWSLGWAARHHSASERAALVLH